MSNKHYRTPFTEAAARTPAGSAATSPPRRPPHEAFVQGTHSPEEFFSFVESLAGDTPPPRAKPPGQGPRPNAPYAAAPAYSPEHIEMLRQVMRRGHPLQGLVKERQAALYAELGGDDIEEIIVGLKSLLRLGQRCLAAEIDAPPPADGKKRPRPLVSASEYIRATAELRRWHERREKLKEEALLRVAEEMQLSMEQMKETLTGSGSFSPPLRENVPDPLPQTAAKPDPGSPSPQNQPRAPAAA